PGPGALAVEGFRAFDIRQIADLVHVAVPLILENLLVVPPYKDGPRPLHRSDIFHPRSLTECATGRRKAPKTDRCAVPSGSLAVEGLRAFGIRQIADLVHVAVPLILEKTILPPSASSKGRPGAVSSPEAVRPFRPVPIAGSPN